MIVARVSGVRRVVQALRRADERFERGVSRGLRKAGLLIQREAQLMTPVDTGALKASAFTRATGQGWETKVIVGFTVKYAMFVHERVGMKWRGRPRRPPSKGRYWDPIPRARARFLAAAAEQNAEKASQIVRTEAIKSR